MNLYPPLVLRIILSPDLEEVILSLDLEEVMLSFDLQEVIHCQGSVILSPGEHICGAACQQIWFPVCRAIQSLT